MKNSEEDWLQKCLTCKHIYVLKTDDTEYRCRCRSGKCNYEKFKEKSKMEAKRK